MTLRKPVSQLPDNISAWINTEKRRIEETIADFMWDIGVSPQDSVSNIGRHLRGILRG